MALAAASGLGNGTAERGWIHRKARVMRQLHVPPLCRGSYFWKQHPRGLQWMLLVLAPALTVLESLVKLHLAASQLFKHRKGGYWLQEVSDYFFLSTVRSGKHRFGLPGAAPAVRRSSKLYACKVTANSAERYLKGRIQSLQPGSAPSRLSSRGQEPPSLQPKCLHYHSSPFVSLHAPSKSHSPRAAQNHVLLYRAEGFAGKTGHRRAGLLQAALQSQCCTSKQPGSPGHPLLLLSCSLAVMLIIKKPLCVSREAGLREGHKDSRSCVFANNPAEL